jgi:hypothetical protein
VLKWLGLSSATSEVRIRAVDEADGTFLRLVKIGSNYKGVSYEDLPFLAGASPSTSRQVRPREQGRPRRGVNSISWPSGEPGRDGLQQRSDTKGALSV